MKTLIFEDEIILFWKPEGFKDAAYKLFLNGELLKTSDKTHFEIKNLTPETEYEIKIVSAAKDESAAETLCDEIFKTKQKRRRIDVTKAPYNAVGDGKTLNTAALQRAIDDCGESGTLYFPKGEYLSGALRLHSDMELYIEEGAVIKGTAEPKDYLPVSDKNIDEMYTELVGFIQGMKNPYLKQLLSSFFIEDKDFEKRFKFHSAAKSVHHGFVGGLLEHTLGVTKLCNYYTQNYPILNKDLLLAAAIFHDIGKLEELSVFPANDYTDEGQLLGHIMIGAEMVGERIRTIPGFPPRLANELKHCILAHHGELEYGSPKKPALAEAVALSFADNTDAKMETIKEIFAAVPEGNTDWVGYNRMFESNLRRTSD